jgi:hypothetical protein
MAWSWGYWPTFGGKKHSSEVNLIGQKYYCKPNDYKLY